MTAKTSIFNLTSQSSKEDEIAALQALADAVNEGTYLKSLFTPGLINWVTEMINNDFAPDVMDNYSCAKADANFAATLAQDTGRKLTETIERLERDNASLRETEARRIAHVKQLQVDLNDQSEYIARLQENNLTQDSCIDELNAKIRDLKALIFDLQNPLMK